MPAKKQKPVKSKLLQAFEFLSLCQKDSGINDAQMHCRLSNKTAIAFDGIVACGIVIEDDFDCCPHTYKMTQALANCGPNFAITQISSETLQVRSDGFEAFVPCCDPIRLQAVNPEAGIIPVSSSLTRAIEICAPLASEKSDILEAASIQINANSVIATNREMVIEAWHGSGVAYGNFLLPKIAATAIVKSKKKIIAIGFKTEERMLQEQTSIQLPSKQYEIENITFWFEDGSWLRSNLYKGKWRENVAAMLKIPSENTRAITSAFFDTVKKVLAFSDDDKVYCAESKIASHHVNTEGAIYSLPAPDAPNKKIYKGKNLLIAGLYANEIDETQGKNITMFYGPDARCAVWHDPLYLDDEDIPF